MAASDSSPIPSWLYDRIRSLLTNAGGPSRRPEYRPRRKGLVVTICTLASILLWFTFAMRETYTRILVFPTEVRNLPDDQALVDLPPTHVRAQVEGEGIQLIRLYYDPPVIPIDASNRTVDLNVTAPDFVKNVRMDNVTPSTITVYRDTRARKRVPIRSRASVAAPSGHHLIGGPVLEPDSVTVSGASSILEGISFWPTSDLTVNASKDTLVASVSLSDTLAGLVVRSVDAVMLRGRVREFTEGSRVVDVVVLDAPPGQHVSLEPAAVRITFQVPVGQYDAAMASTEIWAAVPYSAIRSDTTGAVVPVARYPDGIAFRNVRIDPPALRYFDVLD